MILNLIQMGHFKAGLAGSARFQAMNFTWKYLKSLLKTSLI